MTVPAAAALLALFAPAFQEEPAAPPVAGTVAETVAAATDGAEASWSVMLLGGERIGYVTQSSGETPGGDLAGRIKTAMTFKRFGQELRMVVDLATVEAKDGAIRSFELRTENPGSAPTTAVGTVEGATLTVRTTVNGAETVKEIELPDGAVGPGYIDRALEADPLEPGETREYPTFFAELGKAGVVAVAAGGRRRRSSCRPARPANCFPSRSRRT